MMYTRYLVPYLCYMKSCFRLLRQNGPFEFDFYGPVHLFFGSREEGLAQT